MTRKTNVLPGLSTIVKHVSNVGWHSVKYVELFELHSALEYFIEHW
jgi:hypothetical protein